MNLQFSHSSRKNECFPSRHFLVPAAIVGHDDVSGSMSLEFFEMTVIVRVRKHGNASEGKYLVP